MAKLTNHVQRTRLITPSTDKHYSLDSEDDFRSGCRNVSHQQQFFSELLSPGRSHNTNYCLTNVAKFSCAVDCFLELCYFVFRNHLENITCNDIFQVIYDSCNRRENLGAVEIVREPVWSLIRGRCTSFSAMTADAVLSDIFTMQTFGDLTNDLKSLFLIEQCNQTCCALRNNQIEKTTSTIVLYITLTEVEGYQTSGFSKNLHRHLRRKHQSRHLDPGFYRATRSPASWIGVVFER